MKDSNHQPAFGTVHSVSELGAIIRHHRKNKRISLESVSGISQLSIRFLSELERGKETAELGKALKALQLLGLELVIQPRGKHDV